MIDKIAHRYIDIFNLNEIIKEKFIADKLHSDSVSTKKILIEKSYET